MRTSECTNRGLTRRALPLYCVYSVIMINFITFDDISRLSRDIENKSRILAKAQNRVGKTVFLSHSQKDEASLPLIISILENHGAQVYVDVKDDSLPLIPSVETAQILRESLSSCQKFILFVTPHTKSSKWIPWELGVSDGHKGQKNVALIPAADHAWDQSWAEQEYLGLYDRVIWGNFANKSPEWLVYNHHQNTAVTLSWWLNN
jgi:hypothetical protein